MNDNEIKDLPSSIERLIDRIEKAGVNWYILGGHPKISTFIAFDTGNNLYLPSDVQEAMYSFKFKYENVKEIKEQVFEYGLKIGCVYQEAGNKKPIWNLNNKPKTNNRKR